LIRTGEQSLLRMRIVATINASIVLADEKLTAFVELESAIRTAETCENPTSRA